MEYVKRAKELQERRGPVSLGGKSVSFGLRQTCIWDQAQHLLVIAVGATPALCASVISAVK